MSDSSLPEIKYEEQEVEVWKYCYPRLKQLFKTHACKEFNWTIEQFEKHINFREDSIPQLDPISKFLQA